jgi:hypothetical protein
MRDEVKKAEGTRQKAIKTQTLLLPTVYCLLLSFHSSLIPYFIPY